jgi:hypothetical protein
MPFLLPPLPPDQDSGGGRAALAGGAPGAAAAGDRWETERKTRAIHPCSYLGRGLLVEVTSSAWAVADYGAWRWWCLEAWGVGRLGWGGVRRGGEPRRPFYRRRKVGSGEDF